MKEYLFDDDVTAQWLGRELFAPRENSDSSTGGTATVPSVRYHSYK